MYVILPNDPAHGFLRASEVPVCGGLKDVLLQALLAIGGDLGSGISNSVMM